VGFSEVLLVIVLGGHLFLLNSIHKPFYLKFGKYVLVLVLLLFLSGRYFHRMSEIWDRLLILEQDASLWTYCQRFALLSTAVQLFVSKIAPEQDQNTQIEHQVYCHKSNSVVFVGGVQGMSVELHIMISTEIAQES